MNAQELMKWLQGAILKNLKEIQVNEIQGEWEDLRKEGRSIDCFYPDDMIGHSWESIEDRLYTIISKATPEIVNELGGRDELLKQLYNFYDDTFMSLYGKMPRKLYLEPCKLTANQAMFLKELLKLPENGIQIYRKFSDGQRHILFDFVLPRYVQQIINKLKAANIPFSDEPFLP